PWRRRAPLAALLAVLLGWPAPAAAADALRVARAFCQADGRGARLGAGSWSAVAPMVAWSLDPAWDRIHLISGFQLGDPRRRGDTTEIEVQYTIVADVTAAGVVREPHVETRTLTLEPTGDGSWRLRGPPAPPFVFASEADADALAELLDPANGQYLSNSGFVWSLLRDAGWELPHRNVTDLPSAPGYGAQRTANVGDLALYYDHGTPYHVAMVESDDRVVSATLNGGLRRTPFGAFAGEIRYLRPGAATPTPAPTPDSTQRRGDTEKEE
ncbi:MAG: hypothetical protein SF182_00300, partial [Deltaproteobacteria bacterium]|nr:hypothetical protein [Deltaproteobacteria bacterium]